ncbi:MAG: hypothetical protein ACJ74Z_13905 [Bryobacteraceae bacterium]
MSQRGRPFQPGNTFGQGRPRGSPNKKSLALQELLLNQGGEIIQTLIDRAKEGERTALALCVERLIPRLKDVSELPLEQSRQDPELTINQYKETPQVDTSGLTPDEFEVLQRLLEKTRLVDAGCDRGRAPAAEPAQDGRAVPGDGSAAA